MGRGRTREKEDISGRETVRPVGDGREGEGNRITATEGPRQPVRREEGVRGGFYQGARGYEGRPRVDRTTENGREGIGANEKEGKARELPTALRIGSWRRELEARERGDVKGIGRGV